MSNLISLSQQRSFLRGLFLFHGAGLWSRVGFSLAAPILHINEVLKGTFDCKRTAMTLLIDRPSGNPLKRFARTWWITDVLGTIVWIARANGRNSLWFLHTLILAGSFFLHEFSKFRFRHHRRVVFSAPATLFHLFENSIDGTATRRSPMGSKLVG